MSKTPVFTNNDPFHGVQLRSPWSPNRWYIRWQCWSVGQPSWNTSAAIRRIVRRCFYKLLLKKTVPCSPHSCSGTILAESLAPNFIQTLTVTSGWISLFPFLETPARQLIFCWCCLFFIHLFSTLLLSQFKIQFVTPLDLMLTHIIPANHQRVSSVILRMLPCCH